MASSTLRTLCGIIQSLVMGPMSAATGAITRITLAGTAVTGNMLGESFTPGGYAPITYNGGAGAYTLQTPVAGSPFPVGSSNPALATTGQLGDDGKELTIQSQTARAHVVTTAAGKIIGVNGTAYGTMTFAANAGCNVKLIAYNGLWYVQYSNGITFS